MRKLALILALSLCLASPNVEAATLIFEPPAPATEPPPRAVPEDPIVEITGPDGSVAKNDVSGKGAVLCSYSLFLITRAVAELCDWPRSPADDAIDEGLADIEAFILANSNPPMTEADLAARRMNALPKGETGEKALVCDAAGSDYATFAQRLRDIPATDLQAAFAEMLSVPREPVMNPCF